MWKVKQRLLPINWFTAITLVLLSNVTLAKDREKMAKTSATNTNDKFLCIEQTRSYESAMGIPQHLLTALSLAESGNWDADNQELFAWPWTITINGNSYYLPSKKIAISKVKQLRSKGYQNMDVGCMQINLYYHPNAFENLTIAFDPERNVGYAANFLAALNQNTRSWPQAVANYHSTRPVKNQNYLNKVLGLWQRVSNKNINVSGFKLSPYPAYFDPSGRAAQSATLNSRFRARLKAEKNAKKPSKRKQDLEAWRRGRFNPNL